MKLEPPSNLDQLCLDLGIGLKRRARLSEEKGKTLVPWLQKVWVWTRRQDRGRFLHPHATAGVPDYVDNPGAGMREEPEAVPEDYQNVLVMEAHKRTAEHRKVERGEAETKDQARHVSKQLQEVAVSLIRAGVDPVPFLAGLQRQIATQRDQLRDAA